MKSKKLLLGSLSTMALVATPIAAVVSCDKKDPAATAAGDKKAAFQAADLIKRIGKDDKGFAVTLDGMGVWYVSEADAATKTTIMFHGNKIELPVITSSLKGGKAVATKSDAIFKEHQKDAKDKEEKRTGHTDASVKAAVEGVKKTMELNITAVAKASTIVGQYVVNKHMVAADTQVAKAHLQDALTTKGGEGSLYKFEFTPDSSKTATPVLTDASKKAFEKIFTDLGLSLNITFAKTTVKEGTPAVDVEIITPTISLFVASKVADAEAITNQMTLIGGAAATGDVAIHKEVVLKAKGTPMTAAELFTALNKVVKGAGTGLANGNSGTVTDAMIKPDMKITVEIIMASNSNTDGQARFAVTSGVGKERAITFRLANA